METEFVLHPPQPYNAYGGFMNVQNAPWTSDPKWLLPKIKGPGVLSKKWLKEVVAETSSNECREAAEERLREIDTGVLRT